MNPTVESFITSATRGKRKIPVAKLPTGEVPISQIGEIPGARVRHCKFGHVIDRISGKCAKGHKIFVDLEDPNLKIGFLDIETHDLQANFGYMISWCIKRLGCRYEEIDGDYITADDVDLARASMKNEVDFRILETLIKAICQYDVIVTYYGSRFDIKYMRTRAIKDKLSFPLYGEIIHWDLYFVARNRLKLSSNRLGEVARLFGSSVNTKSYLDGDAWTHAPLGNVEAMKYIYEHNKQDVITLEKVYFGLLRMFQDRRTSV